MTCIESFFQAFAGPANFGRAIGVSTEHAAQMRRRRSIPADYWPRLIEAARERGIDGITFESLAEARPARRRKAPAGGGPCPAPRPPGGAGERAALPLAEAGVPATALPVSRTGMRPDPSSLP